MYYQTIWASQIVCGAWTGMKAKNELSISLEIGNISGS
jgi:hypothetical protein